MDLKPEEAVVYAEALIRGASPEGKQQFQNAIEGLGSIWNKVGLYYNAHPHLFDAMKSDVGDTTATVGVFVLDASRDSDIIGVAHLLLHLSAIVYYMGYNRGKGDDAHDNATDTADDLLARLQ